MLRERNEKYGTINFVNISSEEYSPEKNQGLDYKTVCYSPPSFELVTYRIVVLSTSNLSSYQTYSYENSQ